MRVYKRLNTHAEVPATGDVSLANGRRAAPLLLATLTTTKLLRTCESVSSHAHIPKG